VLFSARDRLLSVRSSRRTGAPSDLREVVDEYALRKPATEAAKAARQPRYAEGREPLFDADVLHPIDYGGRHQPGHELGPEEPPAVPAQDTLEEPEVEEEQNDPGSHAGSYRGAVSRPNWSQPLPKLLIISGVMTAATLNDVRVMIERHLPVASRTNEMWKYVSSQLREAALGGDTAEFCPILEMALSIEGLECAFK
jgi:hypothetical protein